MRIVHILFVLLLLMPVLSVQAKDYPFEPAAIELSGVVTVQNRYGPPGYGEDPCKDEPLTVFVLRLPEKVTIGTENSLSESNDAVVNNVQLIQLKADFELQQKLQKRLGKTITVQGQAAVALGPRDFFRVNLHNVKLND